MGWSQVLLTSSLPMVLLALALLGAETDARSRRRNRLKVNPLQLKMNGTENVRDAPENAFMSSGDMFQVHGCPYEISWGEARRRKESTTEPGNIIRLLEEFGRAGNHYLMISAYLAMGFCCRSRVLELPGKDGVFASAPGMPFQTERRWFNFSDAWMPWEEYKGLQTNSVACRPRMKYQGGKAFFLEGVDRRLLQCMNRVYLRGCEAAYLGNLTDTSVICPPKDPQRPQNSTGSLVVHIRSGDVFGSGKGESFRAYGQPPLKFILLVMQVFEWDDVTVLTAGEDNMINPIFAVLEEIAGTGILRQPVFFHKNRSLLEDMRTMLCADALVLARSTLGYLTLAHTRATKFFFPTPCGPGRYRRERGSAVMTAPENTTLLMLEKPNAEVYGIDLVNGSLEGYTVYDKWKATLDQKMAMIMFDGVKHLRRCQLSDDFGAQSSP